MSSNDLSSATMFPALKGIGALRIATTGSIFANTRIFNDLVASGRGTFGQNVPAHSRSRALSQGVLLGLSNVTNRVSTNAASARTNIRIMNPNDVDTDVELELRDGDANQQAVRIITVPAGQMILLPPSGSTGLLGTLEMTFRTRVSRSSARHRCSCSVRWWTTPAATRASSSRRTPAI